MQREVRRMIPYSGGEPPGSTGFGQEAVKMASACSPMTKSIARLQRSGEALGG